MSLAASPSASVTATLNRAARRIFQSARHSEWTSAVLDAALAFSQDAILFSLRGPLAHVERATISGAAIDLAIATAEAPAILQALESLEPVAAACTASQISPALANLFPAGARAFLFPIHASRNPVALLLATGVELDPNGLELVATLAGASWELSRQRNADVPAASIGLVSLVAPPAAVAVAAAAAAAEIPADAEWHQRARRFASVRVAELRLYQAAKVAQGRQGRNLYTLFQEVIDHERALFRAQFMEKSPTMVDYLHEELVRTLAQGEADRMGGNYPGAMARNN